MIDVIDTIDTRSNSAYRDISIGNSLNLAVVITVKFWFYGKFQVYFLQYARQSFKFDAVYYVLTLI